MLFCPGPFFCVRCCGTHPSVLCSFNHEHVITLNQANTRLVLGSRKRETCLQTHEPLKSLSRVSPSIIFPCFLSLFITIATTTGPSSTGRLYKPSPVPNTQYPIVHPRALNTQRIVFSNPQVPYQGSDKPVRRPLHVANRTTYSSRPVLQSNV